MGAKDMVRQAPNVARMELLGARIRRVDGGSRTLKDAINEAMRDWVANVQDTYYLLGSALGPHPYPLMVREFQSVIGLEARRQILAQAGRLPDTVVACVGGGVHAKRQMCRQDATSPSLSIIVSRSLSPRPDRFTSTTPLGPRSCATRRAAATA